MRSFARAGPLISTALSINFHQSVSNFLQSITFRPDTPDDTVRSSSPSPRARARAFHAPSPYLYIKLMVGGPISFGNTVFAQQSNRAARPPPRTAPEKACSPFTRGEISFSAGGPRFTSSWFPFRRVRTTERSEFDRFRHFPTLNRTSRPADKRSYLLISVLVVLPRRARHVVSGPKNRSHRCRNTVL